MAIPDESSPRSSFSDAPVPSTAQSIHMTGAVGWRSNGTSAQCFGLATELSGVAVDHSLMKAQCLFRCISPYGWCPQKGSYQYPQLDHNPN